MNNLKIQIYLLAVFAVSIFSSFAMVDSAMAQVLPGWTDDGTVVRLTDIGDLVGIGTTSPGNKIEVVGSGLFKGGLYVQATSTMSSLIATSTLEVRSTNGSSLLAVRDGNVVIQGSDLEIGTVDVYGRTQIWNKGANAVLRLGADTADGDPADVDSEGVVIYKPSADQLGRIKADRFGLTRASDSSLYYFRVDGSSLFYRANPPDGDVHFYVERATGKSGFGTSTPGERLGIEGNLLVDATTTTGALVATTSSIKIGGVQYEFPGNDGDVSQVLISDGNGVLSWATPSAGGLEKLADVTLGSASTTVIAQDFAARPYLKVVLQATYNETPSANPRLQFNSDSGNNYSDRFSNDGAADSTETSQTGIFTGDITSGEGIFTCEIMNRSDVEKSVICLEHRGGGSGSAPKRTEVYGTWANTAAQIHTIIFNSQSPEKHFAAGTRLMVFGAQ